MAQQPLASLGPTSSDANSPATALQDIVFNSDFEPPGTGQPRDTSGAGSRDGNRCSASEDPIQAFMPDLNFGLTLAEQPTIFVEIPETTAQQVVLTLRDESGSYYERAFLPIAEQDGISSFTLPEQTPPLTPGHNYQWHVVLVCGETVQPDDPVLTGWVQRVELTADQAQELSAQTSLLEQAQWYAERGYWYEFVGVLVDEAIAEPTDLELQNFLQSLL
ncbi:DUF928 domain-containing protein [Oscillatoria sp. CS-180]|uniref:DUF928 domain-containing protein n=1 Tax=Oscillatoria sp. CS-180 TaxID=3021720 RepID=UPI00232DF8D6|nr:DUF928 domain-containing protein [Oscillatoria sp. CS-180]MDB9527526.1 DUF928 domain-containing protein [Oscillatoria sp. CS-180]